MHCTGCALLIDDELQALPGVISAKTSYAKSQSVVEFEDEVKNSDLVAAVKRAGYEVEN